MSFVIKNIRKWGSVERYSLFVIKTFLTRIRFHEENIFLNIISYKKLVLVILTNFTNKVFEIFVLVSYFLIHYSFLLCERVIIIMTWTTTNKRCYFAKTACTNILNKVGYREIILSNIVSSTGCMSLQIIGQ